MYRKILKFKGKQTDNTREMSTLKNWHFSLKLEIQNHGGSIETSPLGARGNLHLLLAVIYGTQNY